MQRISYFVRSLWVDRHLSQWITTIMIMVHVGLGTAIIAGGVIRFSRPSHNPLVDYVGGHVWIWGAAIIFSGILMSTPFRWPNIVGLWLGMVWHVVWMSAFTVAILEYETASTTPLPMYGGLAMICAALLTARVIEKLEE